VKILETSLDPLIPKLFVVPFGLIKVRSGFTFSLHMSVPIKFMGAWSDLVSYSLFLCVLVHSCACMFDLSFLFLVLS